MPTLTQKGFQNQLVGGIVLERSRLDRISSWQAFHAAHPGQGWRPNYEEEHLPPPRIRPQADRGLS